MSLPPIEGSVTIITGASSGIGRAAAREFARAGARVVLASRNETRLQDLAAEISAFPSGLAAPLVVRADVTRDDDVRALAERTLERFGRIDILICNAGVGLYSPVKDLPDDALRRVFEVNFHGVVRCVRGCLPSMLDRGAGLIQVVSSILGRRSVPGYAGYCATKFALGAMVDALRVEVARSGVRVQTIYPGLTATEFPQNSILRDASREIDPAAGAAGAMRPAGLMGRIGLKVLPGLLGPMTAEAVARRMLGAARSGRRDTVLTAGGRALLLMNSLSPSLTDWVLARAMTPRGVAIR